MEESNHKKWVSGIPLYYDLEWEGRVEISQIRKELDLIEELGGTYLYFEIEEIYGDDVGDVLSKLSIKSFGSREETDEEFHQRLQRETVDESEKHEHDDDPRRREFDNDMGEFNRIKLKYNL